MTCTFFGHRTITDDIEHKLYALIENLIINNGVSLFYVGNQGAFDYCVRNCLKILRQKYPHIRYAVVLAYLPRETKKDDYEDYSDTIFPDGLEVTPPKFAIVKRNRWMIEKSDYVITYVKNPYGGAAKFKELSEKKGKVVYNIAELL